MHRHIRAVSETVVRRGSRAVLLAATAALAVTGCSSDTRGHVTYGDERFAVTDVVPTLQVLPSSLMRIESSPEGPMGFDDPASEQLLAEWDDMYFGFFTCTEKGPLTIEAVRPIAVVGEGFTVVAPLELTGVDRGLAYGIQPADYRRNPPAIGAQVVARCADHQAQNIMVRLRRTSPVGGGWAGARVTYRDEAGKRYEHLIPYTILLCGTVSPCRAELEETSAPTGT